MLSADGTMGTAGDVGYVDADGYLYLTDRATFMIISGGVNVYPQECENLLITHPQVADAGGVRRAERPISARKSRQPSSLVPGIDPGPDCRRLN